VVARELRTLFSAGTATPNDVAILVRRQKAAGPLARALARAGIQADVVGGDGFWQRPEVSDLVCALALALDPHDELSVLSVLRSPFLCATDDSLLALYEHLPDEQRFLSWPRALQAARDEAIERALFHRMSAFDALLSAVRAHVFAGRSARALDLLLDEGGYAAAMAVEVDGPVRARNVEKLRALVDARGDEALVGIARLGELLDEQPAEAVATARLDGGDDRQAVRIMTIHQAKGLEFPIVVVADAGSGLKGETDDVSFDPEAGLAVTARGRPIAACVGRASARTAPTCMQRVRRRMRERSETELARVLYVALTRARDRLFVVGLPRRQGPGSLAGILERVRAAAPAVVDALLPKHVVDAEVPPPLELPARAVEETSTLELVPPPAPPPGPVRVRASELIEARAIQPGLFSGTADADDALEDEERMPPRAAGRLAHALVQLAAVELAEHIGADGDDDAALRAGLERGARALGLHAGEVAPELLDAIVRTVRGPVRALLERGAVLSFEERLRLERDGVVIEGRADLIARLPDRTVCVELKGSPARAARAELQAMAYAAALAQVESAPVYFARWAVGDTAPAAEAPYKKAAEARLGAALAEIRARAARRDRIGALEGSA
jgi:ATP-dependent exoDNAse (exonuclease V) beta subunit